MTALEFQSDLKTELENIFNGFLLPSPVLDEDGKPKLSKINVFEHNLPILQDEEEDEPFPYIIIQLSTGSIERTQEINVRLLIGVFNEDPDNNGHKDLLNIIQDICERFAKDPVLNRRYVMQDGFVWALQDEDTFPYYFGAVEMTWETAAIGRKRNFCKRQIIGVLT